MRLSAQFRCSRQYRLPSEPRHRTTSDHPAGQTYRSCHHRRWYSFLPCPPPTLFQWGWQSLDCDTSGCTAGGGCTRGTPPFRCRRPRTDKGSARRQLPVRERRRDRLPAAGFARRLCLSAQPEYPTLREQTMCTQPYSEPERVQEAME